VQLADLGAHGNAPDAGAETIVTHPNEPPAEQAPDPPPPDEPEPEANRDFANIVALIFVVALALGGYWLFKEIQRHNEIQNCIASGRRNCIDLVHPDASAP
jgi:uncharacterized protein HemX